MLKECGKKGQFYIMATIVILGMIISIFFIANYSREKSQSRVYEFSEELKLESGKILDYGAVSGSYPWDDFTKNFSSYVGDEVEIIFLTGNYSNVSCYYYNSTGLKTGYDYLIQGDNITLNIDGSDYGFNRRRGENFYFVMYQNTEGERYVTKN